MPTSSDLGIDEHDGETVRRSSLVVGPADDPFERDADRIADGVIDALRHRPTAPSARVRRSAPVGADGGALDAGTSAAIERRRGSGNPLQGSVRRDMETGFGADLGNVRLHTGSESTRLNESMSAQAFTVGNDIFLHDSAPAPSTGAGQHLLAHEIAHTMQTGGGAQRRVHRKMMSKERFNELTYEGKFTGSSKAQKSIRTMLDAYHADFPWEKQLSMGPDKAQAAIERIEEMRKVAEMWINDHQLDDMSKDSRAKRRSGMIDFQLACENEQLTLRDLVRFSSTGDVTGSDHDLSNVTITAPSDEYSQIKEKYTGTATSSFRRLGFLIDGAVPLDGDKASVAVEVNIPIPPGFVGLEMSAEAERDGEFVKAGVSIGVTGGAKVGSVATLKGAIGCYLNAKAKTAADVGELMSYALFRRCRQSKGIPREITNGMFGGRKDIYGWQKAEAWSLEAEKRLFGETASTGAEVSTGAYGKIAGDFQIAADLASAGFEIKGTSGDTIDFESIGLAKGATGARNKADGQAAETGGGARFTTQDTLATQKLGLETSVNGKFGPLSGALALKLGWSKPVADPTTGKPTYSFTDAELGGNVAGSLPMNKAAGEQIFNAIPKYIASINKIIRVGVASAQQNTAAKTGGVVVGDIAEWTAVVAELASVPKKTWDPFTASPATAGTSIGSKATVELGGTYDFMKKEFAIELRLGQTSGLAEAVKAAGDVIDVFKVDISKSSRIIKLTWAGGSWVPTAS